MNTAFVFFTGAACGLLLLAAAKLAINHCNHAAGRWLLLLLAGAFFYLLRPILSLDNRLLIFLIDIPTTLIPGAFWLFAYMLCRDCDDFPRWGWALIAVDVAFNLAAGHLHGGRSDLQHWLYILEQPLQLGLLGAGLITLLQQYQSDLVESRRTLRLWLLIAIGGYMLIVVCAEFLFSFHPIPRGIPTLHAVLASGLALGACLWLLAVSPSALEESLAPEPQQEKPVAAAAPAAKPQLDESQRRLLTRLQQHMDAGGYRHTGLTIRELAQQLQAQEYILRSLINRHLGYRNFNEYLNRYRIDEASARLASPDQAHLPVLSIALDIGYRSLSPFNAAFKHRHKLTPTEYRREHLPA